MKAVIDTNVFVYATFTCFDQYATCRDFLKATRSSSDSWHISWGTVYEYLRVSTHPQLWAGTALTLSTALLNVSKFLQCPNVSLLEETPVHLQFLQQLPSEEPEIKGSILHDAHIVTLMREHEIQTIYSIDTDFHRFKGIRVINPLH